MQKTVLISDMNIDLIPPTELMMDGTTTVKDFVSIGECFIRTYLIQRAQLQPHESVLDIGSGIGQKAEC